MIKYMKLIVIIASVFIVALIIFYIRYPKFSNEKKYIKEYSNGETGLKENIDFSIISTNSAYQVGINKDGYVVFKDPQKAFKQMKIDFSKGISAVRKEYHLLPITRWNYKKYMNYGWQLTIATEKESFEQASKLSFFLDIFQNSLN